MGILTFIWTAIFFSVSVTIYYQALKSEDEGYNEMYLLTLFVVTLILCDKQIEQLFLLIQSFLPEQGTHASNLTAFIITAPLIVIPYCYAIKLTGKLIHFIFQKRNLSEEI
jgi:hypothetical protein